MIGDWVELHNADKVENIQVECIFDGFIRDVRDNSWDISETLIEPIPLTTAILRKNGWKGEFDGDIAEYKQTIKISDGVFDYDYVIQIDCDPYGDFHLMHNGRSFCYINYVHQLQHALNLLGIEKQIEL